MRDKETNPSSYGIPTLPPSWSVPYGISSYIDAPMHLVFLGCVKCLNTQVLEWSALFKKKSTLIKIFSPSITSICDLKLDWCKIFFTYGQNFFRICERELADSFTIDALDVQQNTNVVERWINRLIMSNNRYF